MKPQITRRTILGHAGLASLALAPLANAVEAEQRDDKAPLNMVVAGGHPGDPEAGCGGTIAKYTSAGHNVTCLYLTRGQAGIHGKSPREAGDIRSAEAESACKILKARALFTSQMDGATEVTPARYAEFAKLLAPLKPDVVFTQWPIDTHLDHRACAALTLGAWSALGKSFALYFYEVDLGSDTQCYRPTDFVDVSAFESLKRQACMAHASQNPAGFYLNDHVPMLRFRGMELGCKFAEAFVHHDQSPRGRLPAA